MMTGQPRYSQLAPLLTALLGLALSFPVSTQAAETIAQWTFDTLPPVTLATGSAFGSLSADDGAGEFTGFHPSPFTQWGGAVGNGTVRSLRSNQWSFGGYLQFDFSTLGYENLTFSWDQAQSWSVPQIFQAWYSLDGDLYEPLGSSYAVESATWNSTTPVTASQYSMDLSDVEALHDQASVSLRLVYKESSAPGLQYPLTANVWIDNVLVTGNAIPGPDVYDHYWVNPAGGSFHDPSNWSNSVPGPEQQAWFDLGGVAPYTVDFSADATNDGLVVPDEVTFDLNGHTYEIKMENGVAAVSGALKVTDGTLEVKDGWMDVFGNGLLEVVGPDAYLRTLGDINVDSIGSGRLTVDDGGHVDATWGLLFSFGSQGVVTISNGGNVVVGYVSMNGVNSELEILSGGTLHSGGSDLLGNSTGFGTSNEVTVSGTGSRWDSNGTIFVGYNGTADVTISNGGVIAASNVVVGQSAGAGTIEVSGTDSELSVSSDLTIGKSGTGALRIENGGQVTSNTHTFIGAEVGSHGTVTVTGSDSSWHNAGFMRIGHAGSGELTIADGGAIESAAALIGGADGSEGKVTVTGSGSTWNIVENVIWEEADLYVNGNGKLIVTDGGSVSFWNAELGSSSGPHADVIVEHGGAVVSNARAVIGLGGDAKVRITGTNSTWAANNSYFSVGYYGNGELNVAERLTLAGNAAGATTAQGTLTVADGGTVTVGDKLLIHAGGTLAGGGGTVIGAVENAGLVSPGNSPGLLTIEGDYTQQAGGKLAMDIAGLLTNEYDRLVVDGDVALNGTLQVSLLAFTPEIGNSFDMLDWTGTLTGTFGTLQLPTLPSGRAWNTAQLYTNGILSVSAATLPGDFNTDGKVDAADYVVWRKGLDTLYTPDDYDDWRANFGATAPGAGTVAGQAAAVPEPAAIILLAALLPFAVTAAHRSRKA